MSAFHFAELSPELILDALASVGLYLDSGLTPLNSYENRVYQFMAEDRRRYVAKFIALNAGVRPRSARSTSWRSICKTMTSMWPPP